MQVIQAVIVLSLGHAQTIPLFGAHTSGQKPSGRMRHSPAIDAIHEGSGGISLTSVCV